MGDFTLTDKQREQTELMAGPAMHILAVGGARSGKTFGFTRGVAVRAMKAEGSRHLIARYRFNHVVQSIWHDTFPKVMRICFPDVTYKTDKQNWFIEFPNSAQIWFGGLDEKERTEKVLGNEYATVFLNEVSQITLHARNTVMTRLAQNCGLALKAYYDCNPPMATHWAHRLFIEKREPVPPYSPLEHPELYAALHMNPSDNAENLSADYLSELQRLPARERLRFWEGRWGDNSEHALWSFERIEKNRVKQYPDLQRIVVAVDPSGTKGPEDERSDHVGIVVAGLAPAGHAYVLEDASCKAAPGVWGNVVAQAFIRHDADAVVAEINFGGALVESVIQAAATQNAVRIPFKEVRASRGKVVRAEPIAQLYEQGKVHHVGRFDALEDELISFTSHGYMGDRSPDRADALVWALSELFPRVMQAERAKCKRPVTIETSRAYDPLEW